MTDRLYQVVETLLTTPSDTGRDALNEQVVDGILDHIEIKDNRFNDLVDLVELCNKYPYGLMSLGWFKKKLVDKIYEWRGEEGKSLINKIMKVK